MKPRVTLARATSPDGTQLELVEHAGAFVINADGLLLMSTKMAHSEEELARLGCAHLGRGARVLIGGLGCGYTLRTTLDLLPDEGEAVQAELVPEIVQWNREHLAGFAGRPLEDARTRLELDDVAAVIRRSRDHFDAILLDVDNGPSSLVTNTNAWLYEDDGLQAIRRALRSRGRVAVWSAEDDPAFPSRLARNGFRPSRERVASRPNGKGPRYTIFLGDRES